MFAKKFSGHGPKWYSSFVRRRAWIRKRVKVDDGSGGPELPRSGQHLLNPEYFTVHPAADARRSSSRASSRVVSKASMSIVSDTEPEEEKPDIEDMEALLSVLRAARIDREKIEAVDNFLQHADDDLVHLQDEMHEIMSLFVFQASRRVLMSRLAQAHDDAVQRRDGDGAGNPAARERVDSLSAALKHAEEEVSRLQYWSDVKAMAEGGDAKGAVDGKQALDAGWPGEDKSGPSPPSATSSRG